METTTEAGPGGSSAGSSSDSFAQTADDVLQQVIPDQGYTIVPDGTDNVQLVDPSGNVVQTIPYNSQDAQAGADAIANAVGENTDANTETFTNTLTTDLFSGSQSGSAGDASADGNQASGQATGEATASGPGAQSSSDTFTNNQAGPGGSSSQSGSQASSSSGRRLLSNDFGFGSFNAGADANAGCGGRRPR